MSGVIPNWCVMVTGFLCASALLVSSLPTTEAVQNRTAESFGSDVRSQDDDSHGVVDSAPSEVRLPRKAPPVPQPVKEMQVVMSTGGAPLSVETKSRHDRVCVFPPPIPEHAMIVSGPLRTPDLTGAAVNSTVKFRCLHGFKGEGSRRLRCNESSQWEFHGRPLICLDACVQLLHSKAEIREHKLRVPSRNQLAVVLDRSITFSCLPGHVMTSSYDSLTCWNRTLDASLVFNASLPRCKPLTCRTCDILGHGLIEYDSARTKLQLSSMQSHVAANATMSVGCQFCTGVADQFDRLGVSQTTADRRPVVSEQCPHTVKSVRCVASAEDQNPAGSDDGLFVVDGNTGEHQTLSQLAASCFDSPQRQ